MLDIKAVRQDPEAVAAALQKRGFTFDAEQFKALDARRKQADKRGGDQIRKTWNESRMGTASKPDEVLSVDEALTKLTEEDPELAKLVSLRYFAGMTVPETATALGVSTSTVDRQWAIARAWLYREINGN